MSAAHAITGSRNRVELWDRFADVATVLLISIAALASAWCGYQAARWSGTSTLNYNLANSGRVTASTTQTRLALTQLLQVSLFVEYQHALFSGNKQFAAFLYRRFPPELKTAVDAWLATQPLSNTNAPRSPFAMPQYHVRDEGQFAVESARADDLISKAVGANKQSDDYVFLTVILASVSFLGGVATKMRYPRYLLVILLGAALLVFAVTRLFQAPVA